MLVNGKNYIVKNEIRNNLDNMAMSLNRTQLIGNLTADPELKQIPGGQVVAKFSVATSFNWTDQAGQKQSKSEFHNIIAWRKLAEICGQYLKKGSKVFVEGRLQTSSWEGEDGVKRYRTEIVAENMIMLGAKGNAEGPVFVDNERSAGGISNDNSQSSEPVAVSEDEVSIDDLPF